MKRNHERTFQFWILAILTLWGSVAFSGSNQNIVYQGRIVRPDGTVPNTGTISFTLSIYSPSPKRCLLYSENQTVSMVGSQGMFSLKLGDGTRTTGVPTAQNAFVTGGALSGLTCGDGSTSYTPAATDDRDLVVSFNDNGTVVNLSAVNVQSVPYALQATKIDGWGVNDIVKVHPTTGSPTTFTTAEMANVKAVGAAACSSNEILKWNGTAWACAPDATGSAPGDAGYGSGNKGTVAFDTDAATSGITVASGIAKLSNTGVSANTYGSATAVPTIAIDAQGRITSATATTIALPVSQLTQSSATSGQVLKWNGSAWAPAADAGVTTDASYAAKGIVQFDTDANTSGITVASGVAKVNTGTGANQIVKLDGTGKLPAVDGSALTNITATGYSGVLPIANGGTNSSTALNNDRIMVSAGGKIVEAAAMTNGQLLIGSTGAAPVVATVGQSNGISITTGAGSLSIATNATPNNTASTIVSRDASGNFAAGAASFNSTVLRGSTSGNLTMRAATTVTDYTLTWPAAVGSAGQFLTTDASGNLSWGSPAAISDSSYATKGAVQFLTDASTSGITVSSGVASVNAGTGANQIVKLNSSSQLPAVDGSLLTNLSVSNLSSGVLPIARGGTNNGSLGVTAGGILYMDGSKAMTTAAGTSGQALISAGAGAPAFGNLGVVAGGTGTTSFAANSLVMANGTGSALTGMTCSLGQILKWDGTAWSCVAGASAIADAGYTSSNKGVVAFDTDAATSGVSVTSGVAKVNTGTGANQIVKLDGTGKLPAVDGSALTNITATAYSGVLPIANGGTNSSTALNNNRMMFSSSGAIVEMPAMTNGQIVVGSTGAAPTVATLGSSNGISITTGAGSLSIATNATSANTVSTIVARDASGNFAAGTGSFSSTQYRGSTSGTLTVTVPATVTDYTIKFPATVGAAGSFLTTDASGNLSWGSPAAIADASYAAKGAVQFLTDASTSGINVTSGVASVNAGTGANQIVKLDGSAKLPAVDGSALTNIGAGQISSGTLPIARGGTNSTTALTNNKVMVSSGGAIVEGVGFGSTNVASTFITRDTNGDFAAGVGTLNSAVLKGGTSGTLTMSVPTTVTSYTLTWPSGVGGAGQFLTTDASGNLSWGSPAAVPDGSYSTKGSLQGLTDAATSGLNIASGVVSVNAGTGANQIVKLNASSQLPAVDGSLLTNLSAGNIGTGTLPIARGGTNSNTALNNDRMMVSSGGKIVEAAAMTNGQIIVGSTGAAPTVATLGSSNGISITTGAGSLSIATNATSANTASTIVSRDASGNFVAGAGSFSSTLLRGSTSGTLTLSVPATVTDYTIKFPAAVGTAGSFLTTDASGNLSWGSPAAIADSSYAAKGAVQFDTDAATSGVSIASGVARVNAGTGANQIVKLNGSSQLPAIDGSLLTNLSTVQLTAGTLPIARGGTNSSTALTNNKVMVSSGGGIVEGVGFGSTKTASTFVTRDTNGDFAAGVGTFDSAVLKGATSGTLTMSVPTTVTSYTLTWPSGVGGAGQFLTTDASGNLSWGSPAAVSDASYAAKGTVQGLTDAATSGLNIASGVISVNSGTGANQIVKLNGSSQLPAVDGSLLTNLSAGNIASGVLPIARGGTNNGSLGVTAGGILYMDGSKAMTTAAGTSGQALISAGAGAPAFGTLGVGGGGTGQASFAPNSLIMANGTGTQLTGMTCTPGQILKWNAGGTAWECTADATGTSPGDASYAAKGIVQFDTDAATSGVSVTTGVAKVNTGTGANQIVKLNGSSQLPAVDGSLLTNLSTSQLTAGTLPIARGGTNSTTALTNGKVMVSSGGAIVEGIGFGSTKANSTFVTRDTNGDFAAGVGTFDSTVLKGSTSGTLTLSAPATVTSYTLTFPSAVGANGSFLTTDASGNLSWGSPAAIADASYAAKGAVQGLTNAATSGLNINSGVISVNSGTGANQIVKLDGSAKLPAVDGSALTNLSAANLSGTVPVANGGTGQSSYTAGDLLYATGATATSKLGIGANGTILTSTGSAPQWSTLSSLGFFADGGNTFTGTATLGTNSAHALAIETNGATRMTIDSSGAVGIGTTAPSASGLHVRTGAETGGSFDTGASVASGLTIESAQDGASKTDAYINFWAKAAGTDNEARFGASRIRSGWESSSTSAWTDSYIAFQTHHAASAAWNDSMVIKGGSVGIGTSSPGAAYSLDVAGKTRIGNANLASTYPLSVQNNAATSWIEILNNGGAGKGVFFGLNNNNFEMWNYQAGSIDFFTGTSASSGTSRMTIQNNGNVGIGAITPNTVLDIDGAFSQRGMAAPAVSVAGQGRIYFDSTSNKFKVSQNGAAYVDLVSAGTTADATYASKGLVQGLTDAATSGLNINSGVISVNAGTGANQIVKLNASSQLPAVDGSLLTNLSAGNIASGVLPIARGGTNNGSLGVTAGGVVYGDGSKLMMSAAGTSGQALISAGAGVPVFGTLGVAGGGTGATTLTANGILMGNGTSAVSAITGTANQVLRVPSGGGAPSFGTAMIAGGGTGATSFAANSLIMANGTGSALTHITCSSGEVLKWDGTAWGCAADSTGAAAGDASYAAKGVVQFDTNAATSGITIASGVAKVNFGTAANQLVKLDASSRLPAVDGSLLTGLSTSQLSAGTLPIARGGTNSASALTNGKVMVSSAGAIVEGAAYSSTNTASTFIMRDASGNFAATEGSFDKTILRGLTSGTLTMAVPTVTTSYTLTWPSAVGAANTYLKTDASGGLSWSAIDGSALTGLNAGNISTGVLPIARGGTNNGSLGVTAGGVVYMDGSKAMTTAAGTSGQALISAGAGAPAFGTLGVAGGGTGLTSFTAGDLMYASGATAISKLGIGASGTILTSTGSAPQWSTVSSLGFFANGGNTMTATATLGTNSAHNLEIETGGSTKMTVESGGNVGIGTTDPFYKFDVYGDDNNVIARIMNGSSTGTRFPAVQVMNYNGGFSAGYPAIQLNSARGNSGAPAAIGSGDKLGAIEFSGAVDNAYNHHNAAGIDAYATQAFATGTPGAGGADLRFFTTANNTRTKSERMRIDQNGNVGIGHTSPGHPLVIQRATGTSYVVTGSNNSDAGFQAWGTRGILLLNDNDAAANAQAKTIISDSGKLLIGKVNDAWSTETTHMTILDSGNVGINQTTPGEKLEVTGNLKVGTGQAYVAVQTSSAASPLTFDTNSGNSMVWSTGSTATPTVNIHNMKAGGSYLLVVQGTGTGAVTINCYSNAGTTALPSSFMPANGARIDGTLDKTMYNIISDGTNCLITWVSGF